jgi:hypothetical protein
VANRLDSNDVTRSSDRERDGVRPIHGRPSILSPAYETMNLESGFSMNEAVNLEKSSNEIETQ